MRRDATPASAPLDAMPRTLRPSLLLVWTLFTVSAAQSTSAVGLFDFQKTEEDELSFRRGETLTILGNVDGEDEWVRAQTSGGQIGLVPISYIRRTTLIHAQATKENSPLAAAAAAAIADAGNIDPRVDPKVADAMRRYRSRRSLYNSGPSELLDRWGVHLDLDRASNSPASSVSAAVLATGGAAAADGDEADELAEHRSGIAGVPFYNLVGYMDGSQLSAQIVQLLREEWLSNETRAQPGLLDGLGEALAAAAGPGSRDVVLTFANSGYADFVLNGFRPSSVPNVLVIALDAAAHEAFVAAGLHSFFDPRMPTMAVGPAFHASAAFMDIMKLRLLYLAEVLLRGYSALLTDADAVFYAPPFAVFPEGADLVVACDATVVPKNWAESPGMVMAGFFYARAGPRPIILLKEVLDYQVRHPEQHDQQSFNQILSELLVADLNVNVMHPRLFPNGFQYFAKRTVQREGVSPLVVQNNWIMGAENKRHRFREAGMWRVDEETYYRGTPQSPLRLLRYDPTQRRVSGLREETSALRAALRIAVLLNRTLLLPRTCAFDPRSGLQPPPPLVYRDSGGKPDSNVLDDAHDADWCTVEWFYDLSAMKAGLGGAWYRESSFLSHPVAAEEFAQAQSEASSGRTPRFVIGTGEGGEAGGKSSGVRSSSDSVVRLSPANAAAGASDDEIRAWFAPHAELRILDLGGLAGRVQMPLDDGDTLDDGAKMGGGDDDGLGDEQMPAGETSNASRDTPAALTRRLMRSVSFREEIARHVRQQVELATPFECLCVQGAADALDDHLLTPASLSAIVNDFRARVSQDKTVFVAGYRMDIEGRILPFQANWDRAYALALYDWNGSGLSGRQFSSVINRLICQRAEKVHFAMGFGGADGARRDQCD